MKLNLLSALIFIFIVSIFASAFASAQSCSEAYSSCETDLMLRGCRYGMTGDCLPHNLNCLYEFNNCDNGGEYKLILGVSETAQSSDLVINSRISGLIYNQGLSDPWAEAGSVKLFSEIKRTNLNSQVTYLVYNGAAIIIIGSGLSEGSEDYAEDLVRVSKEGGITPAVIESRDVLNSDYKLLFDVECPEPECTRTSECRGKDKVVVEKCVIYSLEGAACIRKEETGESLISDECLLDELERTCQGCINNVNELSCLNLGTRISINDNGHYCSLDGNILPQEQDYSACENNYECLSEKCIDNACFPPCAGCITENNECLQLGERIGNHYCGLGKSMNQLKPDKLSCVDNYECITNICKDGQCRKIGFFHRFFGKTK